MGKIKDHYEHAKSQIAEWAKWKKKHGFGDKKYNPSRCQKCGTHLCLRNEKGITKLCDSCS